MSRISAAKGQGLERAETEGSDREEDHRKVEPFHDQRHPQAHQGEEASAQWKTVLTKVVLSLGIFVPLRALYPQPHPAAPIILCTGKVSTAS